MDFKSNQKCRGGRGIRVLKYVIDVIFVSILFDVIRHFSGFEGMVKVGLVIIVSLVGFKEEK